MTTAPAPSTPLDPSRIRLCLLQPALPKYRLPVFRELASRQGIDFQLFYSADEPVKNVTPEGFKGQPIASRLLLKRPRLIWRQAQIDLVDPSRFDILMAGWNTRYLTLVPSLLLAKKRGIPAILWGHGYSKNESFSRRFIRDSTGNLATAILFYGATARNRFVERNGRGERAFVAPNSLDQREIQSARQYWLERPEELRRFKEQHGLLPGPVLLFVSRLVPENHTEMLVRAGAMLRKDYPDIKIVIIGGGDEENNLRAIAKECAIDDRTVFTGAIYDEPALAPWFMSSDLFVYPRNIGLSLLHAMGYGLPVITTDYEPSWAPEVDALKPWINGMTYQDRSVDALAHIVGAVLSDRDRLDRMKASALRTATEDYSLTKMVDGMEAAIRYAYGTRSRH
ncbi:MAG: glycosyltransferase family 4 protein [Phycisphaeraceae bacterium]|nr:glycosyltransferase family 4 protein [Phycisphaeraceae bacterium]